MQLALDHEQDIRDAAQRWRITHITLLPGRIATFCGIKGGGASGPDLTDYEAAVLIAAGVAWSVWQPWEPEAAG